MESFIHMLGGDPNKKKRSRSIPATPFTKRKPTASKGSPKRAQDNSRPMSPEFSEFSPTYSTSSTTFLTELEPIHDLSPVSSPAKPNNFLVRASTPNSLSSRVQSPTLSERTNLTRSASAASRPLLRSGQSIRSPLSINNNNSSSAILNTSSTSSNLNNNNGAANSTTNLLNSKKGLLSTPFFFLPPPPLRARFKLTIPFPFQS